MNRITAVGVLLLASCGARAPATAPPIGNAPATPASAEERAAPASVAGELRLEGMILDDTEAAVSGVEVQLQTRPPLTSTSETDGFFAFDHLAAGTYAIIATAADGRTARTAVELSLASEPVILRLR